MLVSSASKEETLIAHIITTTATPQARWALCLGCNLTRLKKCYRLTGTLLWLYNGPKYAYQNLLGALKQYRFLNTPRFGITTNLNTQL